ncbi:autotransporter outer membrane beta-barrel domain-containing protein, partial [Phascolarctobacterium faecium]|uniref:autotransporter outer membrane beta-barrel domain-containing protein n=1 Tax=Phascolarctobacterium faecium TaxID=33025 RepID=UPI003AF1C2F8
KAGLAKKIAHTLMAMSIVYSSGINIVINEAYAAEKTVDINNSHSSDNATGNPGNNYNQGSGITDGESASIVGVIKDDTFTNAISVTAKGGDGGNDEKSSPTVMEGSKGGDAFAKVTVDESKNNVTLGNITVKATGGRNGSSYQGISQVAGAAAAYGLEVKHDLTITAANIDVSAETDQDFRIGAVDTGSNERKDVLAVGLQIDSGQVNFTGESIKVTARNQSSGVSDLSKAEGSAFLSNGGDTEAYGIRITGGKATVKLNGSLNLYKVDNGDGGGGSGSVCEAGKAVDGGNGGATMAYGVEISGGLVHLDLQAIESPIHSNYFSAGDGGQGESIKKQAGQDVIASLGGTGGRMTAAGVHTTGGKTDGRIGKITMGGTGGNGGVGGEGKSSIGGSGGNGGDAYTAGISAAGGELELEVAGMDISAYGGDGGSIGLMTKSTENVAATGKVQATGGTGGTASAFGLDNREANSKLVAAADIKITAVGGKGGGSNYDGISKSDFTEAERGVIANEIATGTGGTAMAAGIQNTAGSLQATVQKLQISATGGMGNNYGSVYGSQGITGGTGGAAAAYGINILGGTASEVTAAEIVVQATGGKGGYGISANYQGAAVTDVCTGGKGGTGSTGTAYGVSNSGGAAAVTAAKITAQATGGMGGAGGGVSKSDSAYGIGGDGGDGGAAYAYGVYGSGSAKTMIAADLIVAEATAGAAGNGASSVDGVGTAGSNGSTGSKAEAYGVYAENGAVMNLGGKDTDTITIGGKAQNTVAAEGSKAYAIYADNAAVLFASKAVLNTSDGFDTDNAVLTYLHNAVLGFSGTTADRSVMGGTLKLDGSNAFRFTTDLANNKADSITFDTIENGNAKQYIQIGYEEAFKNALSEADIVTVSGKANVLTITNLNGQDLDNFTGQASHLDSPLERFKVTPTVEVSGNQVNITEIALAKEGTPSETAMAVSDAQMALGSMWRIEGNNLMKRMGDLRNDKEAAKGGVWARYYRGEMSADSAYGRSFDQDYTAFQGGIDKVQDYKGGKLYTGIAVNRIDGSAGYNSGSGDMSSTGLGVYASWLGSRGHYLDVIARGSKLANDFKLVDLSGNAAKADYDTWAYGISAEYGYRQDLNAGWFVEPQAELSLGHIGSVDYTTSNDVTIRQDSVNNAVVRLGFLGGKEFTIGGRASNAYVKASALHDFGGNGGATGYYENSRLALQTGDLTGTWYEIGLGANLGIAKNSNLYFDALKTFNGNLRTEWQFNAGLRFMF